MTVIRRPTDADRPAWERLYAAYAEFYRVEQTPAMRARVWGWIHDPAHEVEAFVAEGGAGDGAGVGTGGENGGRLVGLAHFRPYARPLAAGTGGFLDDLFVDPAARGSGAARLLIEAVAGEGRARGWSLIRWITAEDNARARALYDKLAVATAWKTYDIKL